MRNMNECKTKYTNLLLSLMCFRSQRKCNLTDSIINSTGLNQGMHSSAHVSKMKVSWFKKYKASILNKIGDFFVHKLLMLHDVLGCCENTGCYWWAGSLSLGSAERRRSSQWWTVAAQSMKNQLGSTKLLMLSHIGCWREQITSLWLLQRPIIHFHQQRHAFLDSNKFSTLIKQ